LSRLAQSVQDRVHDREGTTRLCTTEEALSKSGAATRDAKLRIGSAVTERAELLISHRSSAAIDLNPAQPLNGLHLPKQNLSAAKLIKLLSIGRKLRLAVRYTLTRRLREEDRTCKLSNGASDDCLRAAALADKGCDREDFFRREPPCDTSSADGANLLRKLAASEHRERACDFRHHRRETRNVRQPSAHRSSKAEHAC
jgi:hypothetical protein